jgi:hypothetical protein
MSSRMLAAPFGSGCQAQLRLKYAGRLGFLSILSIDSSP